MLRKYNRLNFNDLGILGTVTNGGPLSGMVFPPLGAGGFGTAAVMGV